MTKRLVKLVLGEAKENFILKERRLNFSTEDPFRPYLSNAPYSHWWSIYSLVRTYFKNGFVIASPEGAKQSQKD